MPKYLFKHAAILSSDPKETFFSDGFIAINGERIEALGPIEKLQQSSLFLDYEQINCHGKIILPGMINTHCHMPMIVYRSLADDMPDRLKRYLFPLENRSMKQEIARAGAEYAMAELIMGGVTTVFDAYFFESEIAEIAQSAGIRSVLAETIINFPSPNAAKPYGGIAYTRDFLKKWAGHPLVTPAVFCHAIYTNGRQHLKESHAIAREYNALFSMHVAEMDYEVRQCGEDYNMTPVAYLDSLGILDERFLSAHTIKVTPEDMDILAKRNVKVSYNAGSNAKGAKGLAPISDMISRGITVSLGTDGPMSGNTIDIFTQLPLVGKIQKLFRNDRSVFPSKEIIKLATINGASALGMERLTGSLEVGKKADLIMIETNSVNMNPIYDYYSAIVYSANPSNVVMTMVNGQMLMKDRKLLTIDFDQVRRNLLEYQNEILEIATQLNREIKQK